MTVHSVQKRVNAADGFGRLVDKRHRAQSALYPHIIRSRVVLDDTVFSKARRKVAILDVFATNSSVPWPLVDNRLSIAHRDAPGAGQLIDSGVVPRLPLDCEGGRAPPGGRVVVVVVVRTEQPLLLPIEDQARLATPTSADLHQRFVQTVSIDEFGHRARGDEHLVLETICHQLVHLVENPQTQVDLLIGSQAADCIARAV
jgi:hypothetical protein